MKCCLFCHCFQSKSSKEQSNNNIQEYYKLKEDNSKQKKKIIELENKEKEKDELINNLQQENSKLKEKNSELTKNDSHQISLADSNSSLLSNSSNTSNTSFIKIQIKFKDKNYELDVKNKYSLSKVYDKFVKKYELKPNGHFFIGIHEDDFPLCTTVGELKLVEGQSLILI